MTRWLSPQLRVYCILVILLFSGYLIGVHVCNFSLHTLNIYGVYIYIKYVSFPHQLSKNIHLGGGFTHFFIFLPLPGEKQHPIWLYNIFQNGLNQTSQYIHVRYTNMLQYSVSTRKPVGFFSAILFTAQTRPHWRYRGLGALWHQRTQRGSRPSIDLRGGVWRERFLFYGKKRGKICWELK